MVELSAMDTGESPAEVEAKIERMFKGQPKVQCRLQFGMYCAIGLADAHRRAIACWRARQQNCSEGAMSNSPQSCIAGLPL